MRGSIRHNYAYNYSLRNIEELLAARGESVQRDGATIEFTPGDAMPMEMDKSNTKKDT